MEDEPTGPGPYPVRGNGCYRGRFAPSPTGPLHAGSLVAALASWLDARAHGGQWLVRIEDVDTPRCVPGADRLILEQLGRCGLVSDEPVIHQSACGGFYREALERLVQSGQAYPCACSRRDIEQAMAMAGQVRERHQAPVYPGTCRPERGGLGGREPRAWRFRVPDGPAAEVSWTDRRLGNQIQNVATEVGDFVLRRADGLWAYQLAVVVDDARQGITHVVRGEDLTDNTGRQILLQQALGLARPHYLHTPLVLAADGQKLSKQNGARALDLREPGRALCEAARALGLPPRGGDLTRMLAGWTSDWNQRFGGGAISGAGAG
ncbi:MAG TPA: tRNA glutamyl-Q(34) synthetase GluQRS [Hydrogenophaga sp.]|uniref:tRNA glutamyl-Q(34) synthetase GluQRS n=1 Tax=Hydrogenophaga sp. TaxID=1904254 RepID=UPI002CC2E425|nr:tRNA glutamyl-Q(34) synthetase GluQRS [Hydrogenophaga sp.]HMN93934.1 tRNA glutamyl-Q(34) synthetase GluQRS [Hydrogenophaga sp.]HMP10753.1 tRNA glutamyl-Q(34) synthetase GluQRS [Hydrogenophaga sp.]